MDSEVGSEDMKKLILSLVLLTSSMAFAQVDLTPFNLKPSQIEIIRKFEASGKYTEEFLLNFAKAAHNQNLADERRANTYIPPYTKEELEATIKWARGGAFAAFADYAGYRFLGEEYRADCPNVGLFRFGRATGTEFIPQDVMREAINESYALQSYFANHRDQFAELFYKEAVEFGFDIYLEPIN